jgi:hypothetical protein
MTRIEALKILGLSEGASAEAISKAYRRRAFETHPDRGGTATGFLRVQAAYEVLGAGTQCRDAMSSEFESMLDARVSDIRSAFILLCQESSAFCDRSFEECEQAFASTIDGYQSYSELKQNAQRDLTSVWSRTVQKIALFVEEKVDLIADRHDKWLQDYLRPVLEAARAQNPPLWFERVSIGVALILLALTMTCASVYFQDVLLVALAAIVLPIGVLLPLRYHRRFSPKRIIKGIRLRDIRKKSGLGALAVETSWVSEEEAAGGGGFIFGIVGTIFLGPFGGMVGSAVGSLLGWLVGESVTTRKRKLYESVVADVNNRIAHMMAEFNRRLDETEEAMLRAIRENFKGNVRTVVGLLKSGRNS